jgi:hypothetical protein
VVQILGPNRESIPSDARKWRLVAIRNESDCQSVTERIDKIAVRGFADTAGLNCGRVRLNNGTCFCEGEEYVGTAP